MKKNKSGKASPFEWFRNNRAELKYGRPPKSVLPKPSDKDIWLPTDLQPAEYGVRNNAVLPEKEAADKQNEKVTEAVITKIFVYENRKTALCSFDGNKKGYIKKINEKIKENSTVTIRVLEYDKEHSNWKVELL
jgi:hypothetical protein